MRTCTAKNNPRNGAFLIIEINGTLWGNRTTRKNGLSALIDVHRALDLNWLRTQGCKISQGNAGQRDAITITNSRAVCVSEKRAPSHPSNRRHVRLRELRFRG